MNHSTCHCVRVPYDLSRSMWAMVCNISVSFYPSRCKINSKRTHAMDVMLCAQSLSTYICASTLYEHTYRHMRACVTHNPCTDHNKHRRIRTLTHTREELKTKKVTTVAFLQFDFKRHTLSHCGVNETIWRDEKITKEQVIKIYNKDLNLRHAYQRWNDWKWWNRQAATKRYGKENVSEREEWKQLTEHYCEIESYVFSFVFSAFLQMFMRMQPMLGLCYPGGDVFILHILFWWR